MGHAWRSSSSSSSSPIKLLLFMAPLVLVSGFVAILGPKFSSLEFLSSHSWLLGFGAADSLNISVPASSHAKENNESRLLDLHPRVAMVGMEVEDHSAEEKKALSDQYSAFNRSSASPPPPSSPPPPPVRYFPAVDIQEPVSPYLFFMHYCLVFTI